MRVYRKEDIREIDEQAERQGFRLFALMENAGCGLADKIIPLIEREDRIVILSGRGNNGGDGIVLARYLLLAGFNVVLTFPLGEPKTEVAKQHLQYYNSEKFEVAPWNPSEQFDVIIDALLGVGTKLPLRKNVNEMIHWCNMQKALRIAIDVPTGVQANRGEVEEQGVFHADYTFALHGVKPSAFLIPSSAYYGKVTAVSIGLKQESSISVTTRKSVQNSLPERGDSVHKGTFGTSLLVAGSDEMPGSALLAATGALRSGTGKLMIATSKLAASVIAPVVPEATYMLDGLERISHGEIPSKIAAIGIGPGIVNEAFVQKALEYFMKQNTPMVVDAGALLKRRNWSSKGPMILTPHPGEFSRLTGISVKDIQANRIELAKEFSQKHSVILVLKGQYSVIAFPNGKIFINPTGNSGLAKGGSGDVLTGMIVSMLATHKSIEAAVINAVYIHGLCANKWSETNSSASMVASDFKALLPRVLKELETDQ
ncbi:MAG TPA: NAD(P)H-hydrate dehydratase [Pseudogracilibacillus sp.]|nr:NAD(P)H-hydrate dehydratase [Pseudogracilibacillus sp.]